MDLGWMRLRRRSLPVVKRADDRCRLNEPDRLAQKITLPQVTAEISKLGKLTLGFNSFRNPVAVEGIAERDQRFDDRVACKLSALAIYERAIDLQRVDRQALQIQQRRIPGTEVIQREPHAEALGLG